MTTQTTADVSVTAPRTARNIVPRNRKVTPRQFFARLPIRVFLAILLVIVIYPML